MIATRVIDVLLSFLALLILIPLLLPVCILLRFTGEGEVFYWQDRIGIGGKTFKLLKFATMQKNSPSTGAGSVTLKNDPRVLPIGKQLRKTKINELPQLVNILLGDMSVVGPRPLTPEHFFLYSRETQDIIVKVRPGLTGIGSIIFRDEEMLLGRGDSKEAYKNLITPFKGKLEVWYVKNLGIKTYGLVILVTFVVLFFPKSSLALRVFKDLPKPEGVLAELMAAM